MDLRRDGPLKGTFSYALDVNLSSQATGVMSDESGFAPVYRGFFYDPQTGLVDIGDLGGANTFAVALNERGVVTGTSQTDTGAVHAFLYTPGVGMRDIGANAFPSDISEAGNVIGRLGANNDVFYWSDAGGFEDLGPGTANASTRPARSTDPGATCRDGGQCRDSRRLGPSRRRSRRERRSTGTSSE